MDAIRRRSFQVEVFSPHLRVSGRIEPIGPWLDFLNSADRHTVHVADAHVCPLSATNGHSFDQAKIVVNKHDICLIVLLDEDAREGLNLMRHTERAISHIGPYICRCEFHMGAEANLLTFIDELHGDFFAVTEADLYSSIPLSSPLPRHASVLLMNRMQMQLHHAA